MSLETIKNAIRDIPDFPKPGIIFKDITPLLKNPEIFNEIIDRFAENYIDNKPEYIVGIESRGFIFGAPLAMKLGCGFIPVRKKGKLPYDTVEETYDLEYGTATIEIHKDAIAAGDRVVLIDDLLATGGTVEASLKLLNKLKAEIVGIEFVIELKFLNGRTKFESCPTNSLIMVD